mmetsp:Transcript_20654/g.56979  ORF Transcript_20654/g.56979 Transcript_20654/m.56979 type:complete len:253 (-) Transcript_20654:241-999(-)
MSHVQPPAVRPTLLKPELADFKQVISDIGILHVELGQLLVPLPRAVREGVAEGAIAFLDEVPVLVLTLLPVRTELDQILESEEFAARVVEHAVEDHLDATLAQLLNHGLEGVEVAQPPVDLVVVDGVVAVRLRLEHRREVDGRHTQLLEVVVPLAQLLQPVLGRRREVVEGRHVAEEAPALHPLPVDGRAAERVDLVHQRVLEPVRCRCWREQRTTAASNQSAKRRGELVQFEGPVGLVFRCQRGLLTTSSS